HSFSWVNSCERGGERLMMKNITRLFMVGGIVAALGLAQGRPANGRMVTPPDPQTMIKMRVDHLATELNLTDAQKTSATTIFTDAYTAGQAIRSSLQTNRQSLSDAVKKNDIATIDHLAATAGTLSGQLTAIESKADAA